MKKIFTLMAAFALTASAFAEQAVISATYDAETKTVLVSLENDVQISSFQFNYFPINGAQIAYTEKKGVIKYTAGIADRLKDMQEDDETWTVSVKNSGETGRSVVIYDGPDYIAPGTEPVYTISIAADGGAIEFKDLVAAFGTLKKFKTDAFTLNLDGTAINSIKASTENGAIYNIAGQRVNNAQKGIFIQNGKKVLK